MLFEIDGVGAYAEDTWIGRDVRIGGAVVHLLGQRRALRGHDVRSRDTAERDFDTLGVLATLSHARSRRPSPCRSASSATSSRPGRVRVGDPVLPL